MADRLVDTGGILPPGVAVPKPFKILVELPLHALRKPLEFLLQDGKGIGTRIAVEGVPELAVADPAVMPGLEDGADRPGIAEAGNIAGGTGAGMFILVVEEGHDAEGIGGIAPLAQMPEGPLRLPAALQRPINQPVSNIGNQEGDQEEKGRGQCKKELSFPGPQSVAVSWHVKPMESSLGKVWNGRRDCQ